MKRFLLTMAIVLAGVQTAAGGGPGDSIRAVISGQIEAFRAGDMAEAFGFASDGIQGMFETPERFGTMVESGYAMVIAPAELQFLELRYVDGALWQKLLVKDGADVWHVLDYKMVNQDDAWRIDGVQFLRQPDVGA